jgi:hypothetical protein
VSRFKTGSYYKVSLEPILPYESAYVKVLRQNKYWIDLSSDQQEFRGRMSKVGEQCDIWLFMLRCAVEVSKLEGLIKVGI